jgi:hypothetical protein
LHFGISERVGIPGYAPGAAKRDAYRALRWAMLSLPLLLPLQLPLTLAFKAQPRTLPFGSRAEPEQVGTSAQTQKNKHASAQVFEACGHGPLPCTYFVCQIFWAIENDALTSA